MKIVYKVSEYIHADRILLLHIEYDTYQEAEESLALRPPGKYQIQKIFIVDPKASPS